MQFVIFRKNTVFIKNKIFLIFTALHFLKYVYKSCNTLIKKKKIEEFENTCIIVTSCGYVWVHYSLSFNFSLGPDYQRAALSFMLVKISGLNVAENQVRILPFLSKLEKNKPIYNVIFWQLYLNIVQCNFIIFKNIILGRVCKLHKIARNPHQEKGH